MDLVTLGLIALAVIVLILVVTHKPKKAEVVVEDLADIAVAQRPAPVVVEAPAEKPAKKAPAKKATAKKAPAKKPAASKTAKKPTKKKSA